MKTLPLLGTVATALFLLLVSTDVNAQSVTVTVDTNADVVDGGDGLTSLREAILSTNSNASDGDAIVFDGMLSGQTIVLAMGEIVINDDVVIGSNSSPVPVIIDADASSRIFSVDTELATGDGDVSIYDITFTNGMTANGGGLYVHDNTPVTCTRCDFDSNVATGDTPGEGGGAAFVEGTLTLVGGDIISNTATEGSGNGGGILVAPSGTLTASNTTFTSNVATRAGGAIENNDGTVELTDVDFHMNVAGLDEGSAAPGNGGAIHVSATGMTTISGGQATANIAFSEGGAFWNGSGLMTIDGTTIGGDTSVDGNIASGAAADNGGGGVFNINGTVNISNATIKRNQASGVSGSGGGILADSGSVSVTSSVISFNSSSRAGGGIESTRGASLTIEMVDFISNTTGSAPGNGGAIHVTGPGNTTITGGKAESNVASSEGGAFWNGTGTMAIEGTVIGGTDSAKGNLATGAAADNGGAGVFNNGGTVIIDGAWISWNKASGTAGSGGGILNNGGTLTVESTTIEYNVANRAGGGIEDIAGVAVDLSDVNFYNNVAGPDGSTASPGNGGALHVTGPGTIVVAGGTVSGNTAFSEGGGFWNGPGTMTIDGTMIGGTGDGEGNTASGSDATNGGGGLFNIGGMLVVNNATISGNVADGASGSGGGILVDGGSLTMTSSLIAWNSAVRAGGGIESTNEAFLSLEDVDFVSNQTGDSPGNGGAVHVTGSGDSEITGGSAYGNVAASEGGAFWNGSGKMIVSGVTIGGAEENQPNMANGVEANNGGGGLFNNGGELIVQNSVISSNMANGIAGSGGGILNDGGILQVDSTVVSGNYSNRAGGGIESNGLPDEDSTVRATTDSLSFVTLEGNITGTAPGNGGGFHLTGPGTVTFAFSTAALNDAGNEGGGLWNSGAGTMTVLNATISGNTAPKGAGLFQQAGDDSQMWVQYTTIAANDASDTGGGFQADGGSPTIYNVALSGNVAANGGADCFGEFTSDGFNLIEVTSDCTTTGQTSDDITGVSAMFGDLLPNGGLTQTHMLLTGSPAIDAGECSAASVRDQRGYTRVAPCDIGAFELNAIPVAVEDEPELVELPRDFVVEPAYPNPFNPTATMRLAAEQQQDVTVELYNVLGRKVRTLFAGTVPARQYVEVTIDAAGLPSGMYLIRTTGLTGFETQMVTLLK